MKVHFMGIAGSGASAAAEIAKAYGFEVTGCDLALEGHSPKHLNGVGLLAITPAIISFDPENPELKEARKLGIDILTWQEFTGKYLMKDKFIIAVTGTHGKSTTTAMIAKLLEDAKLDPTVLLGAVVPEWGSNYRMSNNQDSVIASTSTTLSINSAKQSSSDKNPTKIASSSFDKLRTPRNDASGIFVIEADEAYDSFLNYKPDISVVTNIEMDHPEYFKNLEAVQKSFEKFLLATKQTIVANISDPSVADVIKVVMKASDNQLSSDRSTIVQYLDYSKNELNFSLKIPGGFNKQNAKAAFQVGLLLGIDPEVIKKSLSSFTGVSRRFEYLGNYKGREVYSDFGHHPTEVKTTMEAARQKWPDKHIWLIFQPHMFSRTKSLFKKFVEVFKQIPVNQILIMEIYPSRETDTGLVNSQELVDAVDSNKVDYISGVEELKKILNKEIRPGDIIFFMGAGDIDQMARKLVVKD